MVWLNEYNPKFMGENGFFLEVSQLLNCQLNMVFEIKYQNACEELLDEFKVKLRKVNGGRVMFETA
jgi:hypothetical protein